MKENTSAKIKTPQFLGSISRSLGSSGGWTKKKSFNLFGFYLSLKGLQDIGGELMYFYHRRVVKIHIIGIFLLC